MSWNTAYDEQMSLWRFWRTPEAPRFARGFAESMATSDKTLDSVSSYMTTILSQERILFEAEPVWVDPNMLTMVENAATSFKIEPLKAEDLIIPTGFMLLPRPAKFTDRHGDPFWIRAFSWAPAMIGDSEGIVLAAYMHIDDDVVAARDPRLLETVRSMAVHSPLSLAHLTPWQFGRDYESAGFQLKNPVELDADLDIFAVQRFMQAMFRLMAQTITTRVRQPPPRATRKRAKKFAFADTKYVTVIQLRRPKPTYGKDHVPAEVEWSHRWLVSGFWRQQYYPSEGLHRQIWINPYVKGPEDKPLIIRQMRAFEFKH
jgi:hypothetical protein